MIQREYIIQKLKNYFSIYELVDKKTYKIHGERAWKFFATEALNALLITREGIGKPMTINNWALGGSLQQRGLRTNVQSIVVKKTLRSTLYLSAHMLGMAFDFDVKGMSAIQVRTWIIRNEHLYPMKIRLESLKNNKPISWVHLDVIHEDQNAKVYLFDV